MRCLLIVLISNVSFEVFWAVTAFNRILWFRVSLVGRYQRFGETGCFLDDAESEALHSSGMSGTIYQTILCHIAEHCNLDSNLQ
jgi:hypothetical protein